MNELRRIPKPVADWGLVLVILVFTQVEVWTDARFAEDRVLAAVFAAGFLVPFGLRRRYPLGSIVVTWGCACAGSLLTASFYNLDWPFVWFMYSAFIAGTIAPLPRSLAGMGAGLVALAVLNLTSPESVLGDFLFPGGFAIAMWAGARTVRNRTLLAAELHEAAALAEERREAATVQAVTEERRRIAREMHDLVGHSVSVMVVQAGGARRILDRDPDRAIEAAVRIEQTGRAALAEMRRLLGLLGTGEGALAPQPTLDALGTLVERARGAGLPVRVTVDGHRRPLPAGAEVAAYRIVQEALTNALKHAGAAPTEVCLRWGPEALEIVVADSGASVAGPRADALPGGGHGLVGMRERVRVYGGELTALPRPDGGFVVRARIPVTAAELQAA